jgi:hypothetical protein
MERIRARASGPWCYRFNPHQYVSFGHEGHSTRACALTLASYRRACAMGDRAFPSPVNTFSTFSHLAFIATMPLPFRSFAACIASSKDLPLGLHTRGSIACLGMCTALCYKYNLAGDPRNVQGRRDPTQMTFPENHRVWKSCKTVSPRVGEIKFPTSFGHGYGVKKTVF